MTLSRLRWGGCFLDVEKNSASAVMLIKSETRYRCKFDNLTRCSRLCAGSVPTLTHMYRRDFNREMSDQITWTISLSYGDSLSVG
jgi:hypothetical protein